MDANNKQMFDECMAGMDRIYDQRAGFLRHVFLPYGANVHDTRATIGYAAGLLERDEGQDRHEALRIIRKIVNTQYLDPKQQWYGTYMITPESPSLETTANPAKTWSNWDPNWRHFISGTMIIILEEYTALLPEDIQDLLEESIFISTTGDEYRRAEPTPDGLYPSYSNPAYMRAIQTAWMGHRRRDARLIAEAEKWTDLVVEDFDRHHTLSEFNSPTYAGVTVRALTMWAKYGPEGSGTRKHGVRILREVWQQLSDFYNPNLKNLAGPWDRSYGFDMNLYVSCLGAYIWSFAGREAAPFLPDPYTMAHGGDFQGAAIVAKLSSFHNSLLSEDVKMAFLHFKGNRLLRFQAYGPPFDRVPRDISLWNSTSLIIGALSYDLAQDANARARSNQFNPAVAQWLRPDRSVGYLSLEPGETSMKSEVGNAFMKLSYPRGSAKSTFVLRISTNPLGYTRDIYTPSDIVGARLKVSGSVDPEPQITFCGATGGIGQTLHGFEYWKWTYRMPESLAGEPWIRLDFVCDEK